MDIYKKYQNAERVLPQNTKEAVLNGDIKVNWIDEFSFWYIRDIRKDNKKGKCFIKVNCKNGSKEQAFNHEKLAEKLNECEGSNYEAHLLPFDSIEYINNKECIKFKINDYYFEYNLFLNSLKRIEKKFIVEADETLSPNGLYTAFVKEHNLYVKKLESGEIIQLTNDGIPNFDYASYPGSNNIAVRDAINMTKKKPGIIWSPDSKKLLTYKLDQSKVKELHVIQSVTEDENDLRPRLYSYRYHFPGDEYVPEVYLYICDIEKGVCTKIDTKPLFINFTPLFTEEYKKAKWLNDNKIYFTRLSRDFKKAEFNIIDVKTLEVTNILKEESPTFLFLDSYEVADGYKDYGFSNRLLNDGKHVIWQSERDGWAHLYLYCAETGKLINQITSGQWAVRHLVDVDEKEGWIYFTAGGRENGRDPYYLHFYRIKFDGTELTLLTPEDAEHNISLSPDKKYFVDSYSRIDLAPKTVLRSVDGTFITNIEEANIDMLLEMGYIIPERFSLKASDGITDLYGIMVKPAEFDETKKYPLIDYIYGGVQCINTPKSFTWESDFADAMGGLESLAQLGFVGIIMDGLGTPQRSKKIHDICYKNLQGCAGLEDHVLCTKELGEKFEFIDMDRIGVWGASGGGYATVRALLEYPDFYKVGVSCSGNHDQRLYNAAWVERYNGLFDKDVYEKQDNTKLVRSLKGKLLLVHGDLDDNVHISQTLRLVDALIKENKDFDLLIIPNQFHVVSEHKYFIRKKWDYFVKHLLRVEPPEEYKIN